MNWSKVGTKCLSVGTSRLGTKDPWVRNDWIPYHQPSHTTVPSVNVGY